MTSRTRNDSAAGRPRNPGLAVVCLAALGMSAILAVSAAEDPSPPASVADTTPQSAPAESALAIWKAQELIFTYSSSTSIFSCSALRSRVESMLLAVGADSIDISVSGCSEFLFDDDISPTLGPGRINRFGNRGRRSQLANVRVRFRSPIVATPEALAELEKTKGYRELLGRVTGKSDVIQEAAAQFPAQRRVVSLSNRTLGFESEECELIEQVARELYPKLGARVVKQSISCFPGQVSLLKPRLEVEALVRLPPPDAAAQPSQGSPEAEQPQTSPKPASPVPPSNPSPPPADTH